MPPLDLLVVGPKGNTHIASSFERATKELGLAAHVEDTTAAYRGPGAPKALLWRLCGRRPYRLRGFSAYVLSFAEGRAVRNLVTIGQAPMTARTLDELRARGVRCVNWSTDDPWNPAHKGAWHLRSLRHYDAVFTPRLSNIGDFRSLGCTDVRHLPFGYDPALFSPKPATAGKRLDVLFVGSADADRAAFIRDFMQVGPTPALVGAYWDRFPQLGALDLGCKSAAELCELTAGAAVNLCLVRRANRDGHVMRSFEKFPRWAGSCSPRTLRSIELCSAGKGSRCSTSAHPQMLRRNPVGRWRIPSSASAWPQPRTTRSRTAATPIETDCSRCSMSLERNRARAIAVSPSRCASTCRRSVAAARWPRMRELAEPLDSVAAVAGLADRMRGLHRGR